MRIVVILLVLLGLLVQLIPILGQFSTLSIFGFTRVVGSYIPSEISEGTFQFFRANVHHPLVLEGPVVTPSESSQIISNLLLAE